MHGPLQVKETVKNSPSRKKMTTVKIVSVALEVREIELDTCIFNLFLVTGETFNE
jgi:hypothetical protein